MEFVIKLVSQINNKYLYFMLPVVSWTRQPLLGQGLFTVEAS
jgi:hypothetical protein